MTLFTSDIKKTKKTLNKSIHAPFSDGFSRRGIDRYAFIKHISRNRYKKTFEVYFIIAVFCTVFNFIYEQFSYGEHSDYMRFMFCVPLIGGAVPFLILHFTKTPLIISRVTYNLWNSGIAALTCGCLIKGIIEISGRTTDYDIIYWVLGTVMLLCGAAVQFIKKLNFKL